MSFQSISTLMADLTERKVTFKNVIGFIESHYCYSPTTFSNGEIINEAGTNEGSAKVFGFAKLNNLSKAQTLALFAEHYQNVLDHPTNSDHANIRNFMKYGWEGISMSPNCLSEKPIG